MRSLAIETATEACSVALFEGDQLLAHDHRVLGRGHAERLVPMIEALPEKGRADRILVSLGPGSFTGVRIGIATARALGFAWQAEVFGYPTLDLVAAMARNDHPARSITVCMNGGHGEWFVQNFGADGASIGAVQSLTPAEATQFADGELVAGNRAQELSDLNNDALVSLSLLPDARECLGLSPSSLTDNLSPIYGRGPDAKLPTP
jgi:tRNA threonylcarbamoyl adenosine modification protein YeaZ